MRRLLTLLAAALVAASLAGCGGSTSVDPYDLTRKAMDGRWERVQVEVGITSTGSSPFTIDRSAIRLVVDQQAGKGSFRLALPAAALGVDAKALAQLGIKGETIDLEVVFDGDALYAKSPVLAVVITALFAQSGEIPTGDLAGWLRLGTRADFEDLGGLAGASALPSLPAASGLDAKTFKKDLEDAGIVLTYVAVEKRDGIDAHHLTAAVDLRKLVENDAFDALSRTQIDQVTGLAKNTQISADLWVDKAKERLIGLDVHLVPTTRGETGSVDISISLAEPDAGVTFDAPSQYVEIPIKELVGAVMDLVGGGLLGG